METRSNKRRRLVSIPSHVSPPRPDDLPAIFESLNDDTLTTILEFVGRRSYVTYAGIDKRCKEIYIASGMVKETFLYGYGPLSVIKDNIERFSTHYRRINNSRMVRISFSGQREFHAVGNGVVCYNRRDVMDWALGEKDKKVLQGICCVAAREERFDILVEVWNNVEDDEDNKEYIFENVDDSAALYGKLNILKWLEDKGKDINKESCAKRAAEGGQLHILKWLREEKDLELKGGCYDSASRYGQLHVLKWLREKQVPWDGSRSFINAICFALGRGNLDVLQWLHNEGCPWEHDYILHVSESSTKLEVIDWLRVNGYIDRIDIQSFSLLVAA